MRNDWLAFDFNQRFWYSVSGAAKPLAKTGHGNDDLQGMARLMGFFLNGMLIGHATGFIGYF